MKRNAGGCTLILAIICAVGCSARPTPATVKAAAHALMSDLHARGLFNGAIVLGRDGEIIYENA